MPDLLVKKRSGISVRSGSIPYGTKRLKIARYFSLAASAFVALFMSVATIAAAFAQTLPGPSPLLSVPGGGTVSNAIPPETSPNRSLADVAVANGYRLGTGDKMKISVYGEDDLSGEFVVSGSGQIQFPLLGRVTAAGLTVDQISGILTQALGAKYLRDPKVNVQIENYRPFYIMGEINRPGEYPYENNLTALGAIALAGGFTYRAKDSDVYIRRTGESREQKLPASNATQVNPGDVVRVAERIF